MINPIFGSLASRICKRAGKFFGMELPGTELVTTASFLLELCFEWRWLIFHSVLVETRRASFDTRPPVISFPHKQPPLRNVVRIANGRRGRQLLRRARRFEELQAGFLRQTVAFAGVDVFAGPYQVLPGVPAAARAGHDVVEAALVRTQRAAGVLAAIAVALADGAGAELRALLGHLG